MDANRGFSGYEIKDELARSCLLEASRDSNRRPVWSNSICVLFLPAENAGNVVIIYCTGLNKKPLTPGYKKCSNGYMLSAWPRAALSFAAANDRQKMAGARQRVPLHAATIATMNIKLQAVCLLFASSATVLAAQTNEPAAGVPSPSVTENASPGSTTGQPSGVAGTNSPVALPTMTVIGDLDLARDQIAPELGAVTYTIGQNQIRTTGQGENASFQQVLLHAPGVVQDEFGEVHVRGDHGDVQYRFNGVLLPEGLNGFGQEIDPHLINSVTLITGTLPAQFGDRTAGIIDVKSKSGAQLNGDDVSIYGGGYDTIHPAGAFGGTTSNLDYFVTVSYLHDNFGIDSTTSNTDPLHDITDQEKAFGYLSYLLDDTSRLTLLMSGSYSDFEIPNTPGLSPSYLLTNSSPPDSSSINENQNEQNYYVVVSYQKSVDNLAAQISAFSRSSAIHFRPDLLQDLLFNGNAAEVRNTDFANGIQADAEYTLNDNHTLRGGLLATYDVERLNARSAIFPAGSQFAPNPTGDDLPGPAPQSSTMPFTISASTHNSGLTSGIYLQDEWHLSEPLTVNYGLRYDRFDVSFDHEDQVSPRVNLVWQVDGATSAHLGYARYFMPPTLQYIQPAFIRSFEYTTDAPFSERDSPQKVERDHYFDAGVSRQITKSWQVNLDSFCKLAKNLLDDGQFGTAVILNNFNYSDGLVYGAELSSTYKHGPFSAYGNFSYVQTEAKDINSAQYEFPDNELNYVAANSIQLDHQGSYTGSGGVSYVFLKNTLLHADLLYGNGLRAGFANLEKLPDYWTMNLGFEHAWHFHRAGIRELKLRFDCLNLLDEVYEIRDGTGIGIAAPAYGARRAFYGGITAVF